MRMNKNIPISRRAFLGKLAVLGGAAALSQFLAGCAPNTATPEPSIPSTDTELPKEQAKPTETAFQPSEPTSPPTPTATEAHTATAGEPEPTHESQPPTATDIPRQNPDLVVARGGEPEDMVRQALAALGGMERFVAAGSSVIVKPNICVAYHSYEYAATTNPWVVGALVKLAYEAGAKLVRVMDYPFGGSPEEAYHVSGIAEQVKAAGGELITSLPKFKFVDTDIPNGKNLRSTKIFDDILNADVVINVPIAKNHGLARLTLGMKNLLGVVWNRPAMHVGLGQNLADITSRVRPALTVIDAVRMLMDNGPSGGNLNDVKKADTIIASPDIVAADSYAATLFGMQPDDLEYIRAGVKSGLGSNDLQNLKIEEIAVGG